MVVHNAGADFVRLLAQLYGFKLCLFTLSRNIWCRSGNYIILRENTIKLDNCNVAGPGFESYSSEILVGAVPYVCLLRKKLVPPVE